MNKKDLMIEERLTENTLARVINIAAYKTKRIENDERLIDMFNDEPTLNDTRRFFVAIFFALTIALFLVNKYLL